MNKETVFYETSLKLLVLCHFFQKIVERIFLKKMNFKKKNIKVNKK